MNQPRVLVLLCTYNERHNLPDVLADTWRALPMADVLVVDDNSPDGTGTWALEARTSEPRLHVLMREGKFGLGSALQHGMAWALQRDYQYIINHDADQSHDPLAAAALLEKCRSDPEQRLVVIGSRYVPGGKTLGLSRLRRWISRILNWYVTLLLRLRVRDCSGSYRCYPTGKLRQVDWTQLTCKGYGFLEEILVHLSRSGARFAEIPITYHARGSGSSKLSWQDVWGVLVVVHRMALASPIKAS